MIPRFCKRGRARLFNSKALRKEKGKHFGFIAEMLPLFLLFSLKL